MNSLKFIFSLLISLFVIGQVSAKKYKNIKFVGSQRYSYHSPKNGYRPILMDTCYFDVNNRRIVCRYRVSEDYPYETLIIPLNYEADCSYGTHTLVSNEFGEIRNNNEWVDSLYVGDAAESENIQRVVYFLFENKCEIYGFYKSSDIYYKYND